MAALVGLAECALRVFDPQGFARAHAGVIERLNVYSEAYGWRPRPGARVFERGAPVSVNALGWRGPVLAPTRGAAPRFVLLGDSMAFGYGVADDATFGAALARAGLEVVNLGVEGFGPDQALLRFEREGRGFAPDAVVLGVCLDNDFADAGLPVFLYDGRHPKPYFTLTHGALDLHDAHLRLAPPQRLGMWLFEHSRLYARLATARAGSAPRETWRERRARVEGDRPAAVALVARLCQRLRDGARHVAPGERAARLVVLLHPNKESYHRGSPLAEDLVVRLRAAGVETLDLAQRFQARGLRFAEFAFDPTGHLNPRGHALTAEELLGWWSGAGAARDATTPAASAPGP